MPRNIEGSAPRALITGVSGQDGSYLAELLASKGYDVYGVVRDADGPRVIALQQLVPSLKVIEGDLTDKESLVLAVGTAQPDEVYNLGAFTGVARSWQHAELTSNVSGMGALRLLEAIHEVRGLDQTRFVQASSSEMFGVAWQSPQNEWTAFHPRSPYAVAKTFAHHMTINFREAYGAFACSAIMYNHESPRRPVEFVTRKITQGVARIALGQQDRIVLGDLDVRRDWGFAGDYVRAMWLMLQQDEPADYVLATGVSRSIRDLLAVAFARIGVEDWTPYVEQDRGFFRPAEVHELVGDAGRARDVLGWAPSVGFEELIASMVDTDLGEQRAS